MFGGNDAETGGRWCYYEGTTGMKFGGGAELGSISTCLVNRGEDLRQNEVLTFATRSLAKFSGADPAC